MIEEISGVKFDSQGNGVHKGIALKAFAFDESWAFRVKDEIVFPRYVGEEAERVWDRVCVCVDAVVKIKEFEKVSGLTTYTSPTNQKRSVYRRIGFQVYPYNGSVAFLIERQYIEPNRTGEDIASVWKRAMQYMDSINTNDADYVSKITGIDFAQHRTGFFVGFVDGYRISCQVLDIYLFEATKSRGLDKDLKSAWNKFLPELKKTVKLHESLAKELEGVTGMVFELPKPVASERWETVSGITFTDKDYLGYCQFTHRKTRGVGQTINEAWKDFQNLSV